MMQSSISRNSLLLGAFALVTAGLLALTNEGTRERIQASERLAAQKALLQIVPLERHSNDLLLDVVDIAPEHWDTLGLSAGGHINIARKDGQAVAAIIPSVAPDGYSGEIKFIAGINSDGSVAGLRVLSHNETPGLGDKVDIKKSDWVLGFNGRSLENPNPDAWTVKKDGGDFDQFTGATITPRAVIIQMRRTLEYFEQNKEVIFQAHTTPSPESMENANEH